jgi:PAS domain S-box-containing protein
MDTDSSPANERGAESTGTRASAAADLLRDAHQRLAFHVNNSPIPVIEWNSEFRLARWSRRAEELFGWRQEELLGRHPSDWKFVHEEDAESVNAVMQRLLSGAEPRSVSRNRNYTKDGRVLHTEWYNSVLLRRDGGLDSILSLVLDVTARVEADDARKILAQSQKLDAIGQLTAGIAHDFNNLLTVILGNLQLLERQAAGHAAMAKRLRTAANAALRGSDLIKRLLAFSRRQVLSPARVDVAALVRESVELFRRTLGEDISVRTTLADDLWVVEIDAHELETALLNLAINARDAMPGGGVLAIEVRNHVIGQEYADRHGDVPAGDYVLMIVSDTGHGMPESVRARVFEPFFTTKPDGRGTGLGLSMVYGFIKQSGGHIEVYTEEGHGTSIKLYLPRATHAGAAHPPPQAAASAAPRGSETVLVVEDNADLRDIAARFPEQFGYTVVTAVDAAEALAILATRDDVDLLFTDIVMPGEMNGDELAAKAGALRPGIAVLYTSGHPKGALRTGDAARCDTPVLLKPYRAAELARAVRAALEGERR